MTEVYERVDAIAVLVEDVQEQTAQFALYEGADDPDSVLNKGMVEEAVECAYEIGLGASGSRDELAAELGDMQWYISEKARHHGISLADICGPCTVTLDEFQRQSVLETKISSLYDFGGQPIDVLAQTEFAMNILVLRVVDAETRTDDRLWQGYEHGLPLEQTLRDLYTFLAVVAERYDLTLSDLLDRTVAKLTARQRKPHVIEDVGRVRTMHERRLALGASLGHLFDLDALLAA
jgi:hypothetical protein